MRAFIAVELPEAFRFEAAGVARRLSAQVKGRYGSPENYHVTLAFLGDVSEREVQLAMDAIDEACAGVGAISVESDGLGKFGRPHDATLWMGLRANDALMQLAADVREALAARAIAFDDKPFKPHITLARRAKIPKRPFPKLPFPEQDYAVAVTLFKSELTSEGPIYSPLHSVLLP